MMFRSLRKVFVSQILIVPPILNSPPVSYHHLPGNEKLLILKRLLCLKMLLHQERESGGEENITCKYIFELIGSNLRNHMFVSFQKFEKANFK